MGERRVVAMKAGLLSRGRESEIINSGVEESLKVED